MKAEDYIIQVVMQELGARGGRKRSQRKIAAARESMRRINEARRARRGANLHAGCQTSDAASVAEHIPPRT